ncbi:nuclear-interacting partner of ALK isoform X1 [Ailuropoda melanoleuca]|uniref:Zinc finger C3HC-type containing 1 n=1 Tax=Ailuropoda melanoleuca TaxID=9646 RepID=G1LFR0_AILME|nr:nuclear-interacting partner of ALK isoform X3 [Ailuropoda melanoleuca]XP_034527934.1 nuclear-interacting partner of ALK isoform X1 [Ailuropoda melanoleuca]
MAAPSEGQAFAAGVEKNWGAVVRSPEGTPQKVRQLIDEGIAPEEGGAEAKDTSATFQSVNGSPQQEQPPLESTSKEAFFSRVETFSSLKWAGKPSELSPLVCAKYGWVTVECDMLKCSSCQAFLCASLQPAFDFDRYKDRCAELKKALCTAHEKFCFWPDSPSPDRFGMLPLDEPAVLLSEFIDRFQSLCHLDLQLPSLRPEDLKTMCLTEDKVSLLLHLLEDELDHRTDERKTASKLGSDIQVHVTACVLSLCGWACSSSLEPMQLSLITCSQCMRKVGLWSFQQIESSMSDLDASFGLTSSPVAGPEGKSERFPLVPESPRRMMTRSQDATCSPGSEQAERSPGPIVSRTRSWDSSSPVDRPEPEAASPTTRTRPVTRSMGTGDSTGLEVPSSPLRRAKRARLCSSSSSDMSSRSFFDPASQHRDWCPWVNVALGKETREHGGTEVDASTPAEPGWKAVLNILLAHKQSSQPAETDSTSLSEKSRKVFRIFRQWESLCSS